MIVRGTGIAVTKPLLKTAMEEVVKKLVDSGMKNPKTIKTAVMLAKRQIIAGKHGLHFGSS